jgi:hypothetical protein
MFSDPGKFVRLNKLSFGNGESLFSNVPKGCLGAFEAESAVLYLQGKKSEALLLQRWCLFHPRINLTEVDNT